MVMLTLFTFCRGFFLEQIWILDELDQPIHLIYIWVMRYVHRFYSNSFSKEPFIKNGAEIPINRDRILLLQ